MKSKFLKLLKNLLWPPKCVGCGEFTQQNIFDTCELPLCESCRKRWEREKLERCPDCELEMTVCNCSSRLLEKAGVEDAVKLFNYSVARNSVGKRAVLYMKRHRSYRAFDFFASQLSFALKRKTAVFDPRRVVVFSVPRRRKSRREYGFDQAELIAKRLAEKCGFRYEKLVVRSRRKAGEQKKNGLAARLKNAKGQYLPSKRADELLEGVECLVVVDDVLTSGASIAGCIETLKKHFGGKFICATVGRTGKRNKK